jgi:hypothetical protein
VLVPKTEAAEKPWVFRADRIGPDASALDLALLAKGYYIPAAPILGPVRAEWDAVYKNMTDHGFSKKPATIGAREPGEAYAWAIQNPTKFPVFTGRIPPCAASCLATCRRCMMVGQLSQNPTGEDLRINCGKRQSW